MMNEDLMYISNLTETIPDSEYENINLVFESLDAVARISNASMFVIDFSKNKLAYRTENLLFSDEATMRDIQRESSNPYWSLIVDDDLNVLLESRSAYLQLIEKFTDEQKLKHTYVIDYHIMLHNRKFLITQKFSPLKLRPDGKLWLGLFFITTSPNKSSDHIAVFGDKFRYVYDFNEKKFVRFMENMKLTLIEKTILLRAAKGLTTEQIADELCRSVNTIKTHKSRLFEKLHVNSMAEALAFTANYDLY